MTTINCEQAKLTNTNIRTAAEAPPKTKGEQAGYSHAHREAARETNVEEPPNCSDRSNCWGNINTTENQPAEGDPAKQTEHNAPILGYRPETDGSRTTAVALVSNIAMIQETLIAQVLLAGKLTSAHLDSCATHCFVDHHTSKELSERGYPSFTSPVEFDVRQGNPLCSTSLVHYVPLSIMREDGTINTWDECLFIVANAGAPVIICYAALRLGGIIRYEPPAGYERLLAAHSSGRTPRPPRRMRAAEIIEQPYSAPSRSNTPPRTSWPAAQNMEANLSENEPKIGSRINTITASGKGPQHSQSSLTPTERDPALVPVVPVSGTESVNSIGESPEGQETSETVTLDSAIAEVLQTRTQNKKRKGDTDMLTEGNPYGKNPPLPEEVMEAVKHLKMLSNPGTTPQYTPSQEEELKGIVDRLRPQWANCLTLQQTIEVADPDTEQFIYDLMDKPIYQTSIFAESLRQCCDLREYEIPQKPGRDTWTPAQPRRYKNPTTSRVVDAWLDALLDNEKCRESKATHPAPITVVEKLGREPRVCIDYRNSNSRSEVPVFPMPDVHEFLDENAGFNYYCSFDMRAMFNQFKIKEEHKYLAAFITNRGVYEPNVVMFGLQGGPQHAVRECGGAMATDPLTNGKAFTEWALQQNALGVQPPYEICPSTQVVKGSRLRPFIDDVTIPSNHVEGMKKLVELFFEFCRKHNLILSRKKAQVMKKHLRMLGFVVSRQGKHLDPHRIIALLEAKKPQSKETLHALLSSFTFVRMFIPNFASLAAPLHEATKGIIWKGPLSGKSQGVREIDPNFVWTPEMVRALDQLRNALLEAPILVAVNWDYPLFLSVDASIRGEGWVLWQLITLSDGAKVAVAVLYGSRKYTESERNWETTRQEASAIKSALSDVYDYVFGQHFYLFSDHLNLRFMQNSVNRAVIRMRDFLAQFNMTVVHCPGIWNNADSISRLETSSLPTGLAQNLLSAKEARIDGKSTAISVGTYTGEDYLTTGDSSLQPSKNSPEHNNKPAPVLTKALCTNVLMSPCSICFLCSLPNPGCIMIEADQDLHEDASALCSSVTSYGNEQTNDEVPIEWEKVTAKYFQTEYSLLTKEAESWNRKAITVADSHPGTVAPLDPLESQSDREDLEWCGEFSRDAVVLKSAAAARFRPHKSKDRNKPSVHSHKRKKVTFSDIPPLRDEAKAVTEAATQSTPADFRMAQIHFPLKEDFLAIHNNESGHHGLDYSYRKLLKHCGSKWANERGAATKIKASLKEFIESCPICQKVRGLKEKVKYKHSFIVSRPFLEVSMDFIVFKREDKNGNRYILVAIDNFTKLVEMKAAPHRDAETVARFLMELQSRYGPMARLRSDKDGAFTGLLISRLNKERGTESVPCIPYHPQANSICERQNAIIMHHLNALILGCALGPESKIGWSDLLPKVFAIINTTPKNPLGISPLSLVYGVFANYDQQLLPEAQANSPGTETNPTDYVEALMAWQNKLLDLSEDIQSEHFKKLLLRTKHEQKVREFNTGDFVLQERHATGLSGKPSSRWVGPFLVLDRRDNDPTHPVLDLMNLTDMKVKEASINDCRQFNTAWFEEGILQKELVKLAAMDDNEYVVSSILSHQPTGEVRTKPLSKYIFEVKWQDFEETTWEPYSSLKDLEPMEAYAKLHPGLNLG